MNPVFLIGAERSGTTLLRLMLNGHPLISWLNEFEYSVDQVAKDDIWPDLEGYSDYLSTNRIFQSTGFIIDKKLNYPDLIKSFLSQKQQRDAKLIIGATCHRHYDRLLRIFPTARFIYLLRDPRDVARSNIGMGWAGNVWKGVDRWIEAENLWERVKQNLRENISYIEVRYENLITAPEATLSAICSFLNVEYDRSMMSYPNYTTYSIPDPSLTEQWKRKMSNNEIELVESKIFDRMSKRGYAPHSISPNAPSTVQKIILKIQDKIFRVRFKVHSFGLVLVLSDFISRKCKLKSLEKRIKIKINEKTKKFLK